MRVKTVIDGQTDNEWYSIPRELNRPLKIALLAWYPVYKSETTYPSRYYNIVLLTRELQEIKLTTVYFNPLINKSSQWQKINKNRQKEIVSIPDDVVSFSIISQVGQESNDNVNSSNTNKNIEDKENYFQGWKYHFVLLEKGEKEENLHKGFIEEEAFSPENVSKTYCKKSSTSGSNEYNPTIGVVCPTNLSKKEMKECLNWRRADDVGNACRKENFLSIKDIENSTKNFCSEKIDREDCVCINRIYLDDYKKEKQNNPGHDYCWYAPCSSGAFLRYDSQTPKECQNQSCNVYLQTTGTGGSVKFQDNYTRQNCFNANFNQNPNENDNENDNTNTDSNIDPDSITNNKTKPQTISNIKPNYTFEFDKKYIFIIVGGIIIIFMLNFFKK